MKEQIEELIQRGKLQKFVKKDYQSRTKKESLMMTKKKMSGVHARLRTT